MRTEGPKIMIAKTTLNTFCALLSLTQIATAQDFDPDMSRQNTLAFSAAYSERYKATLGVNLTIHSKDPSGTSLNLSAARHEKGHRLTLRFDRGVETIALLSGAKLFYGAKIDDQNWQESAYNTRRLGVFVGANWEVGNKGNGISLRYTLGKLRISDVAPTTSTLVASEAGEQIQSSLRLTYSASNKPLRKGAGWKYGFRTSADLYGIGGDTKYANVSFNGRLSREFASGYRVTARTTAGMATGFDGYTPRITERAFLSSTMPRGYAFAGIGPADVTGGNRTGLGGLNYAALSIEIDKDLIALQKSTINGYVFADAGSVWGLDNTQTIGGTVDDSFHMRGSVGIGLGWKNNYGRVLVSYSEPVGNRPSDVIQPWQLVFRTDF